MLSHREFIWVPGHGTTKTWTYALLRTVPNIHDSLQHRRTTVDHDCPHLFRLPYAQDSLLRTGDSKSTTEQPVQGPIYKFMILHTTRCYWVSNLLSCRCPDSYNVAAHCKMWCMWCLDQAMHPRLPNSLERVFKSVWFQNFFPDQTGSFHGGYFCGGVLQTWASGADIYFITICFSSAKLHYHKESHATLIEVHWHLSVRTKSLLYHSGHWIKPQVRLSFQGS